ncbi:MAG: Asp-tRNA(Asn)/Glu-tRNA(Gln) amidotransferase subunit GatB, partial [Parcubacteria group bacterium]
MSDYQLTVGLEIHAELSTRTKMFCDSANNPDEKEPNVNVCPVCMGHPGTLPVINKEAVRSVLRLGVALGGEIADYTEFDRKNYFYPDIPKGYQISQYKHPLVKGGELNGVKITRVHLEEDTAKSTHETNESLVDFNRAGVPLLELVTEPVIHSGAVASKFAKELQLMFLYLGISEANMEKGEMRIEANVSVRPLNAAEIARNIAESVQRSSASSPRGSAVPLGTKVEVKNLNSFRAVEKAILYEEERQKKLIEAGEKVMQETRGWDEAKGATFSQRAKEESHDYRYFPDPDLPKLFIKDIEEFSVENLKKSLPELPQAKRERLKSAFNLKDEDVEMYVERGEWGKYMENAADLLKDTSTSLSAGKAKIQLASNYITSDLVKLAREKDNHDPEKLVPVVEFKEIILMLNAGELSSRGAKDILNLIAEGKGTARKIAKENNLIQKSDAEELKKIAEKIISMNEKAVGEFKNGNLGSLQFLIGLGMKESGGNANPKVLKEVFEELLSK